jgi:hypothetical protein
VVAAAVEIDGTASGRVRMEQVEDVSGESLKEFVVTNVAPKSVVKTNGWAGYNGLRKRGYRHRPRVVGDRPRTSVLFPRVHRALSLLKRLLLGTYQGAVRPKHLQAYLNEFVFRFNRRRVRRSKGVGEMNWVARVRMDSLPVAGGSQAELSPETRNRRMAVLCLEAAAEAETALVRAFLRRLAARLIDPRPAKGIAGERTTRDEGTQPIDADSSNTDVDPPAAAGARPPTIQRWRAAEGIPSREERAHDHRSRDRDLPAFLMVTMERRRWRSTWKGVQE